MSDQSKKSGSHDDDFIDWKLFALGALGLTAIGLSGVLVYQHNQYGWLRKTKNVVENRLKDLGVERISSDGYALGGFAAESPKGIPVPAIVDRAIDMFNEEWIRRANESAEKAERHNNRKKHGHDNTKDIPDEAPEIHDVFDEDEEEETTRNKKDHRGRKNSPKKHEEAEQQENTENDQEEEEEQQEEEQIQQVAETEEPPEQQPVKVELEGSQQQPISDDGGINEGLEEEQQPSLAIPVEQSGTKPPSPPKPRSKPSPPKRTNTGRRGTPKPTKRPIKPKPRKPVKKQQKYSESSSSERSESESESGSDSSSESGSDSRNNDEDDSSEDDGFSYHPFAPTNKRPPEFPEPLGIKTCVRHDDKGYDPDKKDHKKRRGSKGEKKKKGSKRSHSDRGAEIVGVGSKIKAKSGGNEYNFENPSGNDYSYSAPAGRPR